MQILSPGARKRHNNKPRRSNLVHCGNDLVLVAEIAGHKRLETTRRYSLPSLEDRASAMEGLYVEY